MNIQQLLREADIYRMQMSWFANKTPVIYMKGRTQRTSTSMAIEPYALAYGCELSGVSCPKRWRSTFASTSPTESTYIQSDPRVDPSIRKIVGASGPFAAVQDDFNVDVSLTPSCRRLISIIHTVANEYVFQYTTREHRDTDVNELYDLLGAASEAFTAVGIHTRLISDSGYEQFKQAVHMYDQIAERLMGIDSAVRAMKHLYADAGADQLLANPSVSAAIRQDVQNAISHNKLQIFNTLDDIPTGKNLEVWFEGDYEAHMVSGDPSDMRKYHA